MILFLSDYKYYPTAIHHTQTKNKSFIEYSSMLKEMGIKNYGFPLVLYNPLLVDIDPHSKTLTVEEEAMIIEEIAVNKFYLIREIIRVPTPGSSTPGFFLANRGNIALLWLFFLHVTTLLIQPRQTGKSMIIKTIIKSILDFWANNTDVFLLTKDNELRTDTVGGVKELEEGLPAFLRLKTPNDKNNSETVTSIVNNNVLKTAVSQSSEKGANKIGRGHTTPVRLIDEVGYIDHLESSLSSLLTAGTKADVIAKNNGTLYGTIMATTPPPLSSPSGKYAREIYDSFVKFSEKMYDLEDADALNEFIDKNTGFHRGVVIDMNHRKLGYTDDWLRERIRATGVRGDKMAADYLNIWPLGTGTKSPLKKEDLKALEESKTDPIYDEIYESGYMINWYIPKSKVNELKNFTSIAGMDTSEMIGKDETTLIIRYPDTGEVIGTASYNMSNIYELTKYIGALLIKYSSMIWIPESKSTGSAIIDGVIVILLENNEDPFRRIFNWVVQNHITDPKKFSSIDMKMWNRDNRVYTEYKKEFGYRTSAGGRASRDGLYVDTLELSLNDTACVARDRKLISQLMALKTKNNRLDHDVNGKDDMVISWLLTYWFLLNVKNPEFYGLHPDYILTAIHRNSPDDVVSEDDVAQELIMKELDTLKNRLTEARTQFDALPIIGRITHLSKYLDDDKYRTLNLSALLEQTLKKNKKKY